MTPLFTVLFILLISTLALCEDTPSSFHLATPGGNDGIMTGAFFPNPSTPQYFYSLSPYLGFSKWTAFQTPFTQSKDPIYPASDSWTWVYPSCEIFDIDATNTPSNNGRLSPQQVVDQFPYISVSVAPNGPATNPNNHSYDIPTSLSTPTSDGAVPNFYFFAFSESSIHFVRLAFPDVFHSMTFTGRIQASVFDNHANRFFIIGTSSPTASAATVYLYTPMTAVYSKPTVLSTIHENYLPTKWYTYTGMMNLISEGPDPLRKLVFGICGGISCARVDLFLNDSTSHTSVTIGPHSPLPQEQYRASTYDEINDKIIWFGRDYLVTMIGHGNNTQITASISHVTYPFTTNNGVFAGFVATIQNTSVVIIPNAAHSYPNAHQYLVNGYNLQSKTWTPWTNSTLLTPYAPVANIYYAMPDFTNSTVFIGITSTVNYPVSGQLLQYFIPTTLTAPPTLKTKTGEVIPTPRQYVTSWRGPNFFSPDQEYSPLVPYFVSYSCPTEILSYDPEYTTIYTIDKLSCKDYPTTFSIATKNSDLTPNQVFLVGGSSTAEDPAHIVLLNLDNDALTVQQYIVNKKTTTLPITGYPYEAVTVSHTHAPPQVYCLSAGLVKVLDSVSLALISEHSLYHSVVPNTNPAQFSFGAFFTHISDVNNVVSEHIVYVLSFTISDSSIQHNIGYLSIDDLSKKLEIQFAPEQPSMVNWVAMHSERMDYVVVAHSSHIFAFNLGSNIVLSSEPRFPTIYTASGSYLLDLDNCAAYQFLKNGGFVVLDLYAETIQEEDRVFESYTGMTAGELIGYDTTLPSEDTFISYPTIGDDCANCLWFVVNPLEKSYCPGGWTPHATPKLPDSAIIFIILGCLLTVSVSGLIFYRYKVKKQPLSFDFWSKSKTSDDKNKFAPTSSSSGDTTASSEFSSAVTYGSISELGEDHTTGTPLSEF